MEDFFDKVLPRMTEEELNQCLEEILEIVDNDSKEQAIIDPIGLIQLNLMARLDNKRVRFCRCKDHNVR